MSGSQEFKLQQARRDAERAEQTARSLQTQARDAKQEANQAIDYALSVATQADRAQADAGQARRGVAVINAAGQLTGTVVNTTA